MKAMILAAGRGTRLYPLTKDTPKALIPLKGVPLLEILILRLKQFGFDQITVNIHHHGQQIIDFLESHDHFGVTLSISDERDCLLDTGGAVKKAKTLLGDQEPVLIHNVDVISSLDLAALMRHHVQSEALVTLCVQERPSSRYFYFSPDDRLCGWKNHQTGEEKRVQPAAQPEIQRAFSGIHIIGPHFFQQASRHGCFPADKDIFSIVDVYLCLAAKEKVVGYDHTGDEWTDIGKPMQLKTMEDLITRERSSEP
ncbi:MAG: nucleotidyltransferase family protein [Bacteroidales bacterium]|nr:nucleotidyltransferase family protein [Lentimicrobiaceae bacterium]MDD5694151.1 nucleotidyltransferase family protein [Bacteroidales bacterium]